MYSSAIDASENPQDLMDIEASMRRSKPKNEKTRNSTFEESAAKRRKISLEEISLQEWASQGTNWKNWFVPKIYERLEKEGFTDEKQIEISFRESFPYYCREYLKFKKEVQAAEEYNKKNPKNPTFVKKSVDPSTITIYKITANGPRGVDLCTLKYLQQLDKDINDDYYFRAMLNAADRGLWEKWFAGPFMSSLIIKPPSILLVTGAAVMLFSLWAPSASFAAEVGSTVVSGGLGTAMYLYGEYKVEDSAKRSPWFKIPTLGTAGTLAWQITTKLGTQLRELCGSASGIKMIMDRTWSAWTAGELKVPTIASVLGILGGLGVGAVRYKQYDKRARDYLTFKFFEEKDAYGSSALDKKIITANTNLRIHNAEINARTTQNQSYATHRLIERQFEENKAAMKKIHDVTTTLQLEQMFPRSPDDDTDDKIKQDTIIFIFYLLANEGIANQTAQQFLEKRYSSKDLFRFIFDKPGWKNEWEKSPRAITREHARAVMDEAGFQYTRQQLLSFYKEQQAEIKEKGTTNPLYRDPNLPTAADIRIVADTSPWPRVSEEKIASPSFLFQKPRQTIFPEGRWKLSPEENDLYLELETAATKANSLAEEDPTNTEKKRQLEEAVKTLDNFWNASERKNMKRRYANWFPDWLTKYNRETRLNVQQEARSYDSAQKLGCNMWTTQTDDQNPPENVRNAMEVAQYLLSSGGWNCMNNVQKMWLYRWMGPACVNWQLESSWFLNNRALKQFTDTVCEQRFAFLKSMIYHDLLFLFVQPEEAISWFKHNRTRPICIDQELRVAHGKAVLLLDNCQPGAIRIVGMSSQGTLVNRTFDVVNLRVVKLHGDKFDHWDVLYSFLDYVKTLKVQLVSTLCWKNTCHKNLLITAKKYEIDQTQRKNSSFEKSRKYSFANLIRKIMKDSGANVQVPKFFYVPENSSNEVSADNLHKYFEKLATVSTKHKSKNGSPAPENISPPAYDKKYDDFFASCVLSQQVMTQENFQHFSQVSREQISRLQNIQVVSELAHYFPDLTKSFHKTSHITFHYTNILMVNPFLCLYADVTGEVHLVIGDVWFLQPFFQQLQELGIKFHLHKLRSLKQIPKELPTIVYECSWSGLF